MVKNKIFFNSKVEAYEAKYKEQVIKEYKDNPLIEALPPIYSVEEVIDKLAYYPYIGDEERQLKAHLRFHTIQRIFQYFQPLSNHIDLENRISRIIRQGYIARNPLRKEYAESMHEGYKMIIKKNMELESNRVFRTTASGFTFIGVSGIGKSTAINRVLSMYPQVIIHNEYKGTKLSMYQIVWIKLDCPHDGSVKGLCIDFFRKIDDLIGTNYHEKYGTGRYAVNVLLPILSQLAKALSIGIIVIDEIQHANLAKSGGTEKLLNFFVTLINTIGVPVVLIGTPKALNILQSQFRQARRGSGQGDMIWERMKNDENWELLISGMWEYQWVKNVVPLTEEFKNLLYEKSQGITDIAIKIFAMAQIRAITCGREEITKEIIEDVSKENFKLIQPMIDAIKNGDVVKLARYEDIYTVDIDKFLDKEKSKMRLNRKIKEIKGKMKKEKIETDKMVLEKAILNLIELGINPKRTKRIVKGIAKEEKNLLNVNEVVKKAYRIFIQEEENKEKTKEYAKQKMIKNLSDEDLRLIVMKGKKNNKSAYEALKDKGYIKEIEKDFLM